MFTEAKRHKNLGQWLIPLVQKKPFSRNEMINTVDATFQW